MLTEVLKAAGMDENELFRSNAGLGKNLADEVLSRGLQVVQVERQAATRRGMQDLGKELPGAARDADGRRQAGETGALAG